LKNPIKDLIRSNYINLYEIMCSYAAKKIGKIKLHVETAVFNVLLMFYAKLVL
jgi:hypothetical protein